MKFAQLNLQFIESAWRYSVIFVASEDLVEAIIHVQVLLKRSLCVKSYNRLLVEWEDRHEPSQYKWFWATPSFYHTRGMTNLIVAGLERKSKKKKKVPSISSVTKVAKTKNYYIILSS